MMVLAEIYQSEDFGVVAVVYDTVRGYLDSCYKAEKGVWIAVTEINATTVSGTVFAHAVIEVTE